MKRIAARRIGAVVLTLALLVVSAFSLNISVGAATYTPRLSAPASNNNYYYNSNYNVFQKYGYGLPNCTAYAYGRAYEILGSAPKLSWNGAGQWYSYNKSGNYYKYGSTPKLGAIACWCYSGGGHVAVVEKIENGTITLSNSEWGGRTFYLTTCKTTDTNYGGNSWWTFQGFIYILDNATPAAAPTYSTGIYKTTDYLNLRYHAGTGNTILATIPSNTQITVTHLYTETSTGMIWGYTTYAGKSGWVALMYTTYISPLPTTAPTTTRPTVQPTTAKPTVAPTTAKPTTVPTTVAPTTVPPTTVAPTTEAPTTTAPVVTEPAEETTVTPGYTNPAGNDPIVTEPAEETTTEYIGLGIGDVNADGDINVDDATMIQKYVAYMAELTEDQMEWADFDFDGFVTISDVTQMQLYLTWYKQYS